MIKSGEICIGDLKLTTRPGAAPRNNQVGISSLIFPAGNVMFRRKSVCDEHDVSYLFDQGAVSSKHLGHFLSCVCCISSIGNTDGHT